MEDFSYLIFVDSSGPVHVRELTPKDFYLAQILRNEEKSLLPLAVKLIKNPESLEKLSSAKFRKVIDWISEHIFTGNIFSVENWMEVSFHLCKQRWDQSIDWLETQPMSKIHLMLQIYKNHVDEQEKMMKKR